MSKVNPFSNGAIYAKLDGFYAAKPFDLKVLKTDLGIYINSDEDIMEIEMKIEYYETLVQFIDGVIKSIDNRSWDIKHAQDWKKFLAGGF